MDIQNCLSNVSKLHGLLMEKIGSETLVYNERTHQAFCLNAVAGEVWRRLDGVRTPSQIASEATLALDIPISEEIVLFTVGELRRDGLLEPANHAPGDTATRLPLPSRRQLVSRLGAGALLMLPVVASILAPVAAQAQGYTGCIDCPNARPATPTGIQGQGLSTQSGTTLQQSTAPRQTGSTNLFVP